MNTGTVMWQVSSWLSVVAYLKRLLRFCARPQPSGRCVLRVFVCACEELCLRTLIAGKCWAINFCMVTIVCCWRVCVLVRGLTLHFMVIVVFAHVHAFETSLVRSHLMRSHWARQCLDDPNNKYQHYQLSFQIPNMWFKSFPSLFKFWKFCIFRRTINEIQLKLNVILHP